MPQKASKNYDIKRHLIVFWRKGVYVYRYLVHAYLVYVHKRVMTLYVLRGPFEAAWRGDDRAPPTHCTAPPRRIVASLEYSILSFFMLPPGGMMITLCTFDIQEGNQRPSANRPHRPRSSKQAVRPSVGQVGRTAGRPARG